MQLGKLRISMADANAKTPKKLMDGLASIVADVAVGIDRISQMDDAAEIAAEYKKSFDIGQAVAAVQWRKKEIAAEKEAAEIRKAEEARTAQAVAKVDAIAPPVQKEPEKIYTIKFTVKCTKAQGLKLKSYLIQEGIQYE